MMRRVAIVVITALYGGGIALTICAISLRLSLTDDAFDPNRLRSIGFMLGGAMAFLTGSMACFIAARLGSR